MTRWLENVLDTNGNIVAEKYDLFRSDGTSIRFDKVESEENMYYSSTYQMYLADFMHKTNGKITGDYKAKTFTNSYNDIGFLVDQKITGLNYKLTKYNYHKELLISSWYNEKSSYYLYISINGVKHISKKQTQNEETINYTYDSYGRLLSDGKFSMTYDNTGNILSMKNNQYTTSINYQYSTTYKNRQL